MSVYHTPPVTDRPHPVLSRKRWGRMGLRLAAGLSTDRVARAEGIAQEIVEALLGDAEFVALQGEFARLVELDHDTRMKILRDRAYFVLMEAIYAGDLRAASFFFVEEASGRDPIDSLIAKFWKRAMREAGRPRRGAAGCGPDPRGCSGDSHRMEADAAGDGAPGDRASMCSDATGLHDSPAGMSGADQKPAPIGTSMPPRRASHQPPSRHDAPGMRSRRLGIEALTFGVQEELTAQAGLGALFAPSAGEAESSTAVVATAANTDAAATAATFMARRAAGAGPAAAHPKSTDGRPAWGAGGQDTRGRGAAGAGPVRASRVDTLPESAAAPDRGPSSWPGAPGRHPARRCLPPAEGPDHRGCAPALFEATRTPQRDRGASEPPYRGSRPPQRDADRARRQPQTATAEQVRGPQPLAITVTAAMIDPARPDSIIAARPPAPPFARSCAPPGERAASPPASPRVRPHCPAAARPCLPRRPPPPAAASAGTGPPVRIGSQVAGLTHEGPAWQWRFAPAGGICDIVALLGPFAMAPIAGPRTPHRV